jgi:PEP-CTERM motif
MLPTGVLSWTLSSAGVSFNNINASSLNFVSMSLQTNPAGAVEGWFIEYLAPDVFPAYTLTTPPYVGQSGPTGADIYTSRGLLTGTSDGVAFGDSGCTDLCNQGTTNNPPGAASPGTWTVLPEPDTLTLLGLGLISLVGLAAPRRRKQSSVTRHDKLRSRGTPVRLRSEWLMKGKCGWPEVNLEKGVIFAGPATATFEAHPLVNVVRGVGLEVPAECVLSSVTDLDFLGQKVVGEATCDLGAGPFKRVYELEVPFSVPEPSLGSPIASLVMVLGFLGSKRKTGHPWGNSWRFRSGRLSGDV